MEVLFGQKCPAYNFVMADDSHCKYCICRVSDLPNGIDCNYSQVPNCEPEFRKGDLAYRIYQGYVERAKVREAVWNKNHWEYRFGREQYKYGVYKTRKEAEEARCRNKVREVLILVKDIKETSERWGISLSDLDLPQILWKDNKMIGD